MSQQNFTSYKMNNLILRCEAQFIVCSVWLFNLLGESLKNKAGTLLYCAISEAPFQYKAVSLPPETGGTNEHITKANLIFI